MIGHDKAGFYAGLTGACALAALPVAAWYVVGFNAASAAWWKWLLDYALTMHSFPPQLVRVVNFTALGWVTIAVLAILTNPFRFQRADYGGATFATSSMFRSMGLTARSGIVLGRAGGRLLIYKKPLSTLLLAPPGAGKTTGVAIPTLLSWRGAVVINDPKGEVYDATAGWRSKLGPVHRIEWNRGKESTSWNPLSWSSLPTDAAEMEIAVDRLAAIFVQADKAKGADFWVKSAREALAGITLFHLYEAKRDCREATFADILSWMAVAGDVGGDESDDKENDPIAVHYRRAAGTAKIEGYPRRVVDSLNGIANQNFRSRADVLKTAEMGLAVFRNSYVAEATSRSDFDLRSLRASKKPVSVYIVVPPANADVFGPITGALFELAGLMAVSGKGRPILFMLDEVPELPALDIVKRGPAIGRGQDVRFVIIAQDVGQLVERYGKTGFDTIMTTTAYKVVLTQNHPETQEMISRMIGNVTRERSSKSRQLSGKVARGSVSTSLEGVPLVRPEELGSLRDGDQLVIAQQFMRHPIRCKTAFYFKLGVFKRRSRIPVATR